jgi:hypothetical protein
MSLHEDLAPIRSTLSMLAVDLEKFAPARAQELRRHEQTLWAIAEEADRRERAGCYTTPSPGGSGEIGAADRGAEPRPDGPRPFDLPRDGRWHVSAQRVSRGDASRCWIPLDELRP